ncbi:MAG: transglutaminase family protein [Gorillibacterium sp.]|nr:transglutaminase family protein [Gorillibacterium sp.]
MKLEIRHTTRYHYDEPANNSVNEIRLTPRSGERQNCHHHSIDIQPRTQLFTYEDFFGNRVHSFSIIRPHHELVIHMQSTVVTEEAEQGTESRLTHKEELQLLDSEHVRNGLVEYLLPTFYTKVTSEVLSFAGLKPTPVGSLREWLNEMNSRIHREITYDPSATGVATPAGEMLVLKRGVCQDFAHLMIAVCRSQGIPARYVSGYHFVGDLQGGNADFEQASHAWIEAYLPGSGWIGFDPTNNQRMNGRYVKLAHGRDYRDIVPVKGIFKGAVPGRLQVVVDVRRISE